MISIIGKPHNVNIVNYLCMQLIPQIRRAEKHAWDHYNGYEKRGTYRRGFLMGCTDGIYVQLKQQERDLRTAENKVDAMMVVNDNALQEYMKQEFGKLSRGKSSRSSSWEGRAQGTAHGKRMGINHGVSEGRTGSSSKNMGGLLS